MNNITGPKPHLNPSIGDMWYNTMDGMFYVYDLGDRWVATDDDDLVVNVISHIDALKGDPVEAYNRAMAVL